MKKIAHLEDSEEMFLVVRMLLRDKADVIWVNKKEDLSLIEGGVDAFICDGDIPGWDDHFRDVTKMAENTPVFVFSGSDKNHLIQKGMNPNWPYFSKWSQTAQEMIKSVMSS